MMIRRKNTGWPSRRRGRLPGGLAGASPGKAVPAGIPAAGHDADFAPPRPACGAWSACPLALSPAACFGWSWPVRPTPARADDGHGGTSRRRCGPSAGPGNAADGRAERGDGHADAQGDSAKAPGRTSHDPFQP